MQTISYTLSPLLIRTLENINILRREILLYPLSPKREMELRFDAMIDRIFSSLSLSGTPVKKEDIRKILSDYKLISGENNTVKNRKNLPVKQIVFYKHAFDFIREEWLVTPKTATFEDLIKLHNTASKGQLKIGKNRLEDVLTYLQTSSENAVVQAGIAKLQLTYLEPFSRGNDIISTLAAYLFLYKAGLDFRGLLVMEKNLGEQT